ncbi:MAG: thiamine-phosphate kinase [Acidobacteria bacterium]|nr:thiamine-phosphate kinase [Acidobacteriota bacterium]
MIRMIRRQARHFPPALLKHIGDDCAVFNPQFAEALAISTDLLIENVHFRRKSISPFFLGRKALAVNLSDLAAMGARPYASLLALALPADLTADYFREFIRGFLQEARRWQAPLIGGDLSRAGTVQIGVTVTGYTSAGNLIYRSGARVGDAVVLIGELGLSRLGLEILEREQPIEIAWVKKKTTLKKWAGTRQRYAALKAHLLPQPLLRPARWLQEQRLAHAMIDVSDGLASDLFHILRESRVAAELQADSLPLPPGFSDPALALDYALNGGEDYALLLTCSERQLSKAVKNFPAGLPPLQKIGRIVSGKPAIYLQRRGRRTRLTPRGFEHFPVNPPRF